MGCETASRTAGQEGESYGAYGANQCSGGKYTDGVEVCPVSCFCELAGLLVIHPDECVDCPAGVTECPVEAIYAEGDDPAEFNEAIAFNATEAKRVKADGQEPLLKKKVPLPTAEERKKALGYCAALCAGDWARLRVK